MYWVIPLFYLVNGFSTHNYLTEKVPVYRTLTHTLQHEVIGRWNNALTQTTLAIAMLVCKDPQWVEFIAALFSSYLLTDMLHMAMYFYDWIYYVHHAIPVLVYFTLWDTFSMEMKLACFYTLAILELTTPPISLAWTLSKLQKKGWYYPYVSAFAYLNFVGIRIVYFPYYWYTGLPFAAQVITLPYHALNGFWFYKMTKYVLKG